MITCNEHKWFRTGAMPDNRYRCMVCGVWDYEVTESPQAQIQQLQAELAELRAFKQRVMELQPVAWIDYEFNDVVSSNEITDYGKETLTKLYDLKGLKCSKI